MSGIKGMKKYPDEIRKIVGDHIRAGESQCKLSKEYGMSRYAIQSWLKEPVSLRKRGRKPARTLQEYKPETFTEANEMIDRYIHFITANASSEKREWRRLRCATPLETSYYPAWSAFLCCPYKLGQFRNYGPLFTIP